MKYVLMLWGLALLSVLYWGYKNYIRATRKEKEESEKWVNKELDRLLAFDETDSITN